MQLPMLGTTEKTESSKFQVTLVDNRDKQLHPMNYPRIDRFFENISDRNTFVTMFETSIINSGGKLVKNPLTHPLFTSFDIIDENGDKGFQITIYH